MRPLLRILGFYIRWVISKNEVNQKVVAKKKMILIK